MAILLAAGSLGFRFFVVFKLALGRAWLANLPSSTIRGFSNTLASY
jgi:hypothetical protein